MKKTVKKSRFAAREVIDGHETICLCEEDQMALVLDLLAPERVIHPRLREAAGRFKEGTSIITPSLVIMV